MFADEVSQRKIRTFCEISDAYTFSATKFPLGDVFDNEPTHRY
jgi:hypothetical protein